MYQYVSADAVKALHIGMFQALGREVPELNSGCVERSVAQPSMSMFGQERFVGVATKAAAYLWFLTMNHCFLDGNKRVALLTAEYFLRLNGWRIDQTATIPGELAGLVESVAAGQLNLEALADWIAPRLVRS